MTPMLIAHPFAAKVLAGAVTGLVTGVGIDFRNFLAFKSAADVKTYAWGTAALHAVQGLVYGGMTAMGYSAVIG
jgi:hypothetical protein